MQLKECYEQAIALDPASLRLRGHLRVYLLLLQRAGLMPGEKLCR